MKSGITKKVLLYFSYGEMYGLTNLLPNEFLFFSKDIYTIFLDFDFEIHI